MDSCLWHTESTQYIGRAVVALAADPDIMQKSGQVLMVGDVANEYGFTDIDGRQVPPFGVPAELWEQNLQRPILHILEQMGGAGAVPEVLERIKAKLSPVLEKYEQTASAGEEPRWLRSVQLARINMVRNGWLASDSPQVTWEITEAGRQWLTTSA